METGKNETTLDQIEEFLQSTLEKLETIRSDPIGRGRPRILPAVCLWAGVLVCVLRGWNSQLAIWRLLCERGLWFYPRFAISDQAIYNRLEKEGGQPFYELFKLISQALGERLAPFSQLLTRFASEVVAIDSTTLDKVTRHLPLLREVAAGDLRLLPGKLAGVFDVGLQQWRSVMHIENPHENDKVVARLLLEHIHQGALILADMGYFGFAWFDELTEGGYYWLSRLREKTSYRVVHAYYHGGETFDGLVWLGAYRADRAQHMVRLVTFRVGGILHRYITNVLDPQQFSLQEIAVLYARRWDIEMAFKLIKRELGLHLFWSAKDQVIMAQVWAALAIAQILHGLQLEIAARAGVDPFDVSLTLLVEYLPRWYDVDFIALTVERGQRAGFIRPSRRIRLKTPEVDLTNYQPPPPDLVMQHDPRYAGRRCSPVQHPN